MLGSPGFILAGKLKVWKEDLKKWDEEVLGNIIDQKKSPFEELHNLDKKEAVGDLLVVEKERKLGVASIWKYSPL